MIRPAPVPTPERPPISVIVPVRDEAPSIEELHARLRACLPAGAEILLVDDGSQDETPRLIAGLSHRDPHLRGIRFARSFGKSRALARGFSVARGAIIATLDGDLQEDPEAIPRLVEHLREPGAENGGLDLVTGWRHRRQDPAPKVLASRLFNGLTAWLSGVPLRDINCGLKVMRREVVEAITLEGGFHRFIPLLAHWKGFRVGEVPVDHHPRAHGGSRYGGERIAHGLIDLLVLLFMERFERRPSRFFLGAGALLFLVGLLISVFITYLKLSTGTIQSRYPLLILGVLSLVVGTQLSSMGLLAELAVRRRGDPAVEDEGPVSETITPRASQEIAPRAESAPGPASGVGDRAAGIEPEVRKS